MRKHLRSAIACLSLANLLFLSGWRVLLNPSHYTYYYWKSMPGYVEPITLIADTLIVAALIFGVFLIMRRLGINSRHPVVPILSILILVVILNNLRLYLGSPSELSGLIKVILIAATLIAAVVLFHFRRSLGRLTFGLLLVLSPAVPLFALESLYFTHRSIPNQLSAADRTAGQKAHSAGPDRGRVVWIIFDELDESTAFANRRPGLVLPAFDRLRSESFTATNALPPTGETFLSMPSLITGRVVKIAETIGPNDLKLYYADGQSAMWGALPNVFSASRELGLNTALVGWYHPYCRVIGPSLNRCFWETATSDIVPVVGQLTTGKSMKLWFEKALFHIPFMFRVFQGMYEHEFGSSHIQEYENIQAQARATLADNGIDLMLLHLPVPHHPWIFDAASSSLSTGSNLNYHGNLVLADKSLAEMRKQLEDSGTWDHTTILISGDHWWRESPLANGQSRDHRVPFILKLPNQNTGIKYEKPMNTIVSHDLLLSLLKNELRTYDDVSRWMESRSHDTR